MNIAQCCRKCGTNYELTVEENYCVHCFMKDHLKPASKKSKWESSTRAGFICLFTLPLYFVVGFKFGFAAQAALIGGVILGMNLLDIVNWCVRRF